MPKHATDRQRYHIRALKERGWTQKAIAEDMGWSKARISYLLKQPITPKKRTGRPVLFDTEKRAEIVKFIESGAEARDLPWSQVSLKFGAGHTATAMTRALETEGYSRRVARKKPLLTPAMRTKRLKWAQEMAQFSIDDWRKVLWIDESYMRIDGPHRRWKTRRKSQAYHKHCVQPKFRHSTSVMIWGSISGYGAGPMIIWEKDWGNVNAKSYCEHTLPVAVSYLNQFPDMVFMHDLAPGHKAITTQAVLAKAKVVILNWPANSPDLNPIEAVWQRIKEAIYKMEPRPKGREELEACIIQIWQSISQKRILDLVDSMPARIQAVIDAEGGHTKY